MKTLFTTNLGFFGIALIATTVLSQHAVAGVIRQDPNQDMSIASISLANDPRYASVGKLTADGSTGSGVKIGDNWVLTAAHHVYGKNNIVFEIGDVSYTATNVITYNETWGGNYDLGLDLALVEFSSELGTTAAANLWTGDSVVGMVGTNVGFGVTGTGNLGATGSEFNKNAGQNMIDFTGADMKIRTSGNILYQDFDSGSPMDNFPFAPSPSAQLDLEYLIAPGDSGGGLFVDYGGATYLAGIHSFVSAFDTNGVNSDYGDYSGSTSVAAYSDWIYTKTGIERPVPEPASFALLGLGLAGIFFVKRRKV